MNRWVFKITERKLSKHLNKCSAKYMYPLWKQADTKSDRQTVGFTDGQINQLTDGRQMDEQQKSDPYHQGTHEKN